MTKKEDDDLIPMKTVARMLGLGRKAIYKWHRAGILPAPIKRRGRNYWRLGDIRAMQRAAA